MRTIAELTNSVAGILQGTSLTNVTNLYGAIERAARNLAQEADIPDSFGQYNFYMYDGVYDYLAPDTIFGGAFADLRAQGVTRAPWETVTKRPIQLFDQTKAYSTYLNSEVTFQWHKGVPIMRVAGTRATERVKIDPLSDASNWTPTTITSLFTDTSTFWHEPASIRFTLPTTGSISRTLDNSIDLSSYENVGSVFLAMRIQSTDLTNVELRLGTDSSNYISVTVTQGFLGAWQANNFELTQFDLANATTTGTPDVSNINYVELLFTATGSMANVRVGDLFCSMPSAYEMIYYTAAIFLNSGVLSNVIVDDDTEIVLGDAAYTIFEYITAETISSQMGGQVSQIVLDRIDNRLRDQNKGLLPLYRADNPSEELRSIGNYYQSQGM